MRIAIFKLTLRNDSASWIKCDGFRARGTELVRERNDVWSPAAETTTTRIFSSCEFECIVVWLPSSDQSMWREPRERDG